MLYRRRPRSPGTLDGCFKMKWIVLCAGCLTQMILGGIYAWSEFVPLLTAEYGLTSSQCGIIFGATIAVFLIEKQLGLPLEMARTLAVNTLVCGQAFYLFNSRYLHESTLHLKRLTANPVAGLALAVLVLLQLAFVYAPPMHRWFGSAPIEFRLWLVPLAVGAA
ncbi:MAG: hypothetical protein EOM08_16150, partial [Clostridia bacterium]|nr:hypothetical protein [Clostridia bacterium]